MKYYAISNELYAEYPDGTAIRIINSEYPTIQMVKSDSVTYEKAKWKSQIVIIAAEVWHKRYEKVIKEFKVIINKY